MKNAKNAHFWLIDHKLKNILETKGVIILPSADAWKKFTWSKNYFATKPKQGYFIWVKEQIDFPLYTCISIASQNIEQSLQNLLIVEKGLDIKIQGLCHTLTKNCRAKHKAKGKIILKQDASVKYEHIHSWGKNDIVEPSYEFVLEKNAKLNYTYKNLWTPKHLKIDTIINIFENARANTKIIINCVETKVEIKDTLILNKKGANGIARLRLVGRKNSQIKTESKIIAQAAGKGHLDCQGLLIDKDSEIELSPELIIKDKNALLTHEASLGKISEKELNYLRTRGLSETEAINLIVAGFLERD